MQGSRQLELLPGIPAPHACAAASNVPQTLGLRGADRGKDLEAVWPQIRVALMQKPLQCADDLDCISINTGRAAAEKPAVDDDFIHPYKFEAPSVQSHDGLATLTTCVDAFGLLADPIGGWL